MAGVNEAGAGPAASLELEVSARPRWVHLHLARWTHLHLARWSNLHLARWHT